VTDLGVLQVAGVAFRNRGTSPVPSRPEELEVVNPDRTRGTLHNLPLPREVV
jgi:hypothetical protein